MLPEASKKTDGRNVTAGEGTSGIARDHSSTDTALPAGSSHLTNTGKSSTNAKHDGESYNSSDEENPDVTAFEQETSRYQSRGEPNGPAKGKQNHRQQQKPPPSNQQKAQSSNPQNPPPSNPQKPPPSNSHATFTPVPPQQPPPPTRGVAMQRNRIPAMTAYGHTTAPAGRGNRRAN